MATTTNFGWETPDDTDLVKDGAAAIRTALGGVDTSFVDLKGGTTGQILSKASNTDLDYTWVTTDDANAIQNAIVDAKGDLIAATANDTPARLAVGSNGEHLVADSSTSTGLRYQSAYNGNAIINGAMDIWQRGTSFTSTASNPSYSADRWNAYNGRTGTTYSRQSSGLTGFQYSMRVQRDSGNTATGALYLTTTLETADSLRFAGQTVTISFYAKAGANYSGTSSVISMNVKTGTGTDQSIWSFTGSADSISSAPTLTTSWQRFSATGSIPSGTTELGVLFAGTPTGTAGANDWFEITGVQLELGSVGTTFKRAGGTIQGELTACQRYYYRNQSRATGDNPGSGYIATADLNFRGIIQFPVEMRTSPTAVEQNATATDYGIIIAGNVIACSAVPTFNTCSRNTATVNYPIATAAAAGQGGFLRFPNANGYLGWSAEL